MKKECFDRSGLFDEAIYAKDWEFWLRIALFNNLVYSNELWELERDREGSGSKNLKAVYLSNISILEKHEREFNDILKNLNIDLNSKIRDSYRDTGYFLPREVLVYLTGVRSVVNDSEKVATDE